MLPHAPLELAEAACETILKRRSAREFSGESIGLDEFASLLEASYRPFMTGGERAGSRHGFFDAARIDTWIAIQRVRDLRPGLYFYDARAHALLMRRPGDFANACCHIALGQELVLRAAANVFHTTALAGVTERYGERGYRYVCLDTGHAGERLELAAVRLELGVCGIGGYFDDAVNELFDLPASDAVLFMTSIGNTPPHLRVVLD